MAKKEILYPFTKNGSIPDYTGWPCKADELTWKPSESFKATLVLRGYSRGRSAANFSFNIKGKESEFTVFMTDIIAMISDKRWKAGEITATFLPVKRGQNYGIKLVED